MPALGIRQLRSPRIRHDINPVLAGCRAISPIWIEIADKTRALPAQFLHLLTTAAHPADQSRRERTLDSHIQSSPTVLVPVKPNPARCIAQTRVPTFYNAAPQPTCCRVYPVCKL
ncbi:hypothetical protein A0H81_13674 [Grifola frondosa]|uniref:Uncharacterized protein n=1 Tax=Grifola frondosa TaxID=5627 RepID=A0A1C7LNQ5_GRIFR|nr:hypothetical protein A0H81_13674 [Grifola frondosa]